MHISLVLVNRVSGLLPVDANCARNTGIASSSWLRRILYGVVTVSGDFMFSSKRQTTSDASDECLRPAPSAEEGRTSGNMFTGMFAVLCNLLDESCYDCVSFSDDFSTIKIK